jgi:uncharacterized membrane protein YqjE
MLTHEGEQTGVGGAAREVAHHAGEIARLELRLAVLELREKAAALGAGLALTVGAAILVLFALGFGAATVAAAIATTLPLWLALLIVTVGFLLLAGMLALPAVALFRRGVPPVPQAAIEEARLTTEAVKSNGGHQS